MLIYVAQSSAALSGSSITQFMVPMDFAFPRKCFMKPLCKVLFHKQHKGAAVQSEQEGLHDVPSEQLVVSKTAVFVQPVMTERRQIKKPSVSTALGKKNEHFWHCAFLNLSF